MSGGVSNDLLAEVRGIAKRAGAEILKYYARDVSVEVKADASPVTAADRAAEDLILEALASITPDIPTVSEEAVAAGHVPDISGDRFWLVDPLDGTKEFLKRNDEFTVNIALIEARRAVLGVVHVPALRTLYAGAGAGTATLEIEGEPARAIVACVPPEDGLTILVSRSHANKPALAAYLDDIPVKDRLTAGSSVKFCVLAEGRADLYPRFGTTMEWDIAAGHAVLAAAGGSVRDLDGAELTYGKPGLKNPHFIARGRS